MGIPHLPINFIPQGCTSPITINCDELSCDKLEVNYEDVNNNRYELNTENNLEI